MSTPIEALMSESLANLKKMVDVNTIVGEAINTCDENGKSTTIIPVSKVAFGFAAGGSEYTTKSQNGYSDSPMFGGGSGGGVSVKPVAFLVVRDDIIRLLPVSSSASPADKIVDMIPELLKKFNGLVSDIKCKFDKSKKTDSAESIEE